MSLANSGESGGALPQGGSAITGSVDAAAAHPVYRILLHHNGQAYAADVPELRGCSGSGSSPTAALMAAQEAIAEWLRRSGAVAPPLMAPSDLAGRVKDLLSAPAAATKHGPRISPVKQLLVQKFGKMSNREMAGRIGLSGRDAPTMLSAAASGKGTRKARCAIAMALTEAPSRLWPHRPMAICEDDDSLYLALLASSEVRQNSPA